MMKLSIEIPYEDYSVYPSVSITRNAISKYCIKEDISYEFLEDNNMQEGYMKFYVLMLVELVM